MNRDPGKALSFTKVGFAPKRGSMTIRMGKPYGGKNAIIRLGSTELNELIVPHNLGLEL